MVKTLHEMVAEAKREVQVFSVAEADARTGTHEGQPLVIDVREPEEYRAGHLPGALNLPRGLLELKADPKSPGFDPRLQDRSRQLITYCTGGIGARSAMAAQTFKRMGFSDVGWLDGGLTAWGGAGKPVES
jgi:rhodanese-related sulfurtransferase